VLMNICSIQIVSSPLSLSSLSSSRPRSPGLNTNKKREQPANQDQWRGGQNQQVRGPVCSLRTPGCPLPNLLLRSLLALLHRSLSPGRGPSPGLDSCQLSQRPAAPSSAGSAARSGAGQKGASAYLFLISLSSVLLFLISLSFCSLFPSRVLKLAVDSHNVSPSAELLFFYSRTGL